MVEAIGPKPITSTRRVGPVAPASATAASASVVANQAQAVPGGIARELAASPPVDGERVAQIKKAIADGNFPIVPAKIADRLIALKLAWSPNDAQF